MALHTSAPRAGDGRSARGRRRDSSPARAGFRLEQFLEQLDDLEADLPRAAQGRALRQPRRPTGEAITRSVRQAADEAPAISMRPGAKRKSDFFRDIAGSRFHVHAEAVARERRPSRRSTFCSTPMTSPSSRSKTARRAGASPRISQRASGPRSPIQLGQARDLCRSSDRARAWHRAGRDLARGHGLWPRHAALLEGAYPLRDPLPRPRRTHDAPGDPHRARHRRAGHQGHPDRRRAASSRTSR